MTTKTLLWRGLDEPRMEIVYADSLDRAHGTQVGITYELRWRLAGALLYLELIGGRSVRVELGDADFFDLQHSAFFNSLPAVGDGLLDGGPARDYTMRFVRVPELTAEPYPQRYTPLGDRAVHYSSAGFEADISFGEDGYVNLYQDYLERIG
jgi:uncharacterized protein